MKLIFRMIKFGMQEQEKKDSVKNTEIHWRPVIGLLNIKQPLLRFTMGN